MGNCGTREESAVVVNAHAQGQIFVSLTFLSLDLALLFCLSHCALVDTSYNLLTFFFWGNDDEDDDSWS